MMMMMTRVGEESTRSFHYHGEGHYWSLILDESTSPTSAFTFRNLIDKDTMLNDVSKDHMPI